MRLRSPLLLLLATLTAACGNKEGDVKPGAPGSASAPAPTASAAPIAAPVDPKVDALARAVLVCKADESSFESDCAPLKVWRDAKDDFADGKADASLVAMLADPSEKVRYLAARKLNQHGKAFKTDKALAEAVVTAAEKEKTKIAGRELGEVVGRIKVVETGTFDRVKAIVKAQDVPGLRANLFSTLLFNNGDSDAVYDYVRATAKAGEKEVGYWALRSFWTGGGKKADTTCQVFFENIENPTEDVALEAMVDLAWYQRGNCSSRYDALLDAIDKRPKGGQGPSASMHLMWAPRHLCEDEKASAKQKKRAGDIARAVAGNKEVHEWGRTTALESVLACDPAGGKAFVARFKRDPEKAVADKATELLAAKK